MRSEQDLDALIAAAAHLREDADFNRSWTDGRRGDAALHSPEYTARRLAVAEQRDRWATAIEALAKERADKEVELSDLDDGSKVERLKQWVADLQSGMFVNCVYCGHRYGPGETTPVSMADALKAHIRECPEHPLSHALRALQAVSAIRSYNWDDGDDPQLTTAFKLVDAAIEMAGA